MSLAQVLVYFFREALTSMRRSWRITLLAMFTIGTSLFVGGLFLLLGRNLQNLVEEWRGETKIIVYFESEISDEQVLDVERRLAGTPWVEGLESVSAEQAQERFRAIFPTLGDLVEGWGDDPLPASLEIRFDPSAAESDDFESWIDEIRNWPSVAMVDDDRDWLEQLARLVGLVRTLGVGLGIVLLGAAIITIASVVKLTAYLYRHEIEVMRLVGATEFVIRGPFYLEGLLQGLGGGVLALGSLFGAYSWMASGGDASLLPSLLAAWWRWARRQDSSAPLFRCVPKCRKARLDAADVLGFSMQRDPGETVLARSIGIQFLKE